MSKSRDTTHRQTLNSIHNSKIKELTQLEKRLPKLEVQLRKLKNQLNNKLPLSEQYNILSQIDKLQEKINYQQNNLIIKHLDCGNLAHSYLETETSTSMNKSRKGIFALAKTNLRNSDSQRGGGDKSMGKTNSGIDMDYLYPIYDDSYNNTQETKEQLMNRYLLKVKPQNINYTSHTYTDDNYCFNCSREMFLDDCRMICDKCGAEIPFLSSTEKPSLKDPPTQSRCYEYKRDSHLKDTMNKIQGKESTRVPDYVINQIIVEIDREGVENLAELTIMDIRRFLQRHASKGLNEFYENSPQILYRITKIPPATFTPEQESHILEMFRKVQEPFEKYKNTRKNFLSYPYILYKFCELLGYTEFKDKLKLFESKVILYEQDQIWKKICEELGGEETGWTFIPTRHGGRLGQSTGGGLTRYLKKK